MKTGKKENPKPLVEKVAEAKPPVEDTVGKITEKPPVDDRDRAAAARRRAEKPIEKKPDPPKPEPPKPVVENKPEAAEAGREEAGAAEGRSDRRGAEEGDAEEAAAEARAEGGRRRRRRQERDPGAAFRPDRRSRRCSTSAIRSRNAATGDDAEFQRGAGPRRRARPRTIPRPGARCSSSQVERCWKKPYGGIEAQMTEAIFSIKLKSDGTLEAHAGGGRQPDVAVFPRLSGERAARDHRMPALSICRRPISRNGSTSSRCSPNDVRERAVRAAELNDDMTDRFDSAVFADPPEPPPVHRRRGRRPACCSARAQAFGQARVQITEGNVAPLPIAIPNFVAGTPAR